MKILAGYVKSPEGRAALDAAVAEAHLRGAKLVVVHSLRGGSDEELLPAYREELARVEAELKEEGLDHEIRELVRGNSPGEDLLEFAASEGIDMIVIGVRRRSPVGKLVLGSNAQDILLRADCPVLAVKASKPA